MVASAIEGERSDFSVAVLLSNSSITAKKFESTAKKITFGNLDIFIKVRENLTELGLDVEILEDSLSSQGLSVLNNLHDIVCRA